MRILVTGARGKVGAATVDAAAARGPRGHRHGPRRRRSSRRAAPGARYLQADLTDAGDAYALVRGHDAVIHAAAIPDPSHHPPHVVFRNNLMGTFNVAEAAVRLRRPAPRPRLERDGPRLLLPRAPVPARLRAGRRGPPESARRTPTRSPSTSASSSWTPLVRALGRRAASRSARAGCSGRATSSATSGPSCAPAARTRPCPVVLHRRLRPRRGAAPGGRESTSPATRSSTSPPPTTRRGCPLHDLVRRHHGDAVALRALDRPDASGISTAKARRLLGLAADARAPRPPGRRRAPDRGGPRPARARRHGVQRGRAATA